MILVRLKDGTFKKVPTDLLTRMIESEEITHFRRTDGWVAVGSDAVRKRRSPFYHGEERRGWKRFP
ncbi:hypothetical protein DESUT3_09520 [Desulfuromonas versatilis]|uniref:Uncharacterized protein n=1 Tax=Desulfuromonas versatilis TaxID=2802975 RepID=A0ABN6DUU8_9BACT|nr:hypothetical protein [Desulfuromonas versatilis]BCR03883.1 hypothetical protein DESUT3_09520 [Desulfuromonas versatilis]